MPRSVGSNPTGATCEPTPPCLTGVRAGLQLRLGRFDSDRGLSRKQIGVGIQADEGSRL
jgi:hypothetical protein